MPNQKTYILDDLPTDDDTSIPLYALKNWWCLLAYYYTCKKK